MLWSSFWSSWLAFCVWPSRVHRPSYGLRRLCFCLCRTKQSTDANVRVWDLSSEEKQKQTKPSFRDISNSKDTRIVFGDYAYGGATVLSLVKLDAPPVANRMEIGASRVGRTQSVLLSNIAWILNPGVAISAWYYFAVDSFLAHALLCRPLPHQTPRFGALLRVCS